jgi:hypothetical protein
MEESVAYAPAWGGVKLPVLACPACGLIATPRLGPGAGQHAARALCSNPACNRFIQWLPKSLLVQKEAPVAQMMGMARATLVGIVGRGGVTVRYNERGTPIASLQIVVTKSGPEKDYYTLWPVEVWGRKAEQAGELAPGTAVCIEGELRKQKRGEIWEASILAFEAVPLFSTQVPPQASLTGSSN